MVRQAKKKSIEELYGSKYEASKSQVHSNSNVHGSSHNNGLNNNSLNSLGKGNRSSDYGYLFSNNLHGGTVTTNILNSNATGTARRSRNARSTARGDKLSSKDECPSSKSNYLSEEMKKEQNAKSKTSRGDKVCYNTGNVYMDNKHYPMYTDRNKDDHGIGDGACQRTYRQSLSQQQPPHSLSNQNHCMAPQQHQHVHSHAQSQQMPQHQHHHHNTGRTVSHDDDKDDDTEEFFELIRQTVEGAIGKSISELLNRNFKELALKIDRFSSELKNTNNLLGKMQNELSNKVVHYGEENSRHFRYLCMKSEYDKMFYQHQSMMSNNNVTTAAPPTNHMSGCGMPSTTVPTSATGAQVRRGMTNEKTRTCGNINNKMSHHRENCDEARVNNCNCHSSSAGKTKVPIEEVSGKDLHKVSSEEHCISQKSSEVGMREVLEHIQRFCTQMQMNDVKPDQLLPPNSSNKQRGTFKHEEALKVNKEIFEVDDDDLEMSSDGMTPRSGDEQMAKYSAPMTIRSCSAGRVSHSAVVGGGDA